MKNKILFSIMFVMLLYGAVYKSYAQQQNQTAKHITSEDSAAFNALVMYPDTIRLDIFEVCEYPAAIVNMASLQKHSSSGFSDAISNYSKDEQEDFWDLSRYSDLISVLVQGGKKSKEEIDRILMNYPEEIHETALKYGTGYYETLKKIDDLQSQVNNQFAQILMDYPTVTQDALKELTQFPEIISLLNDHLSLSVRIGDHYRRDPQGVIHRMDSLNMAEVRQNAEDAAAWKQNIEQNPEEANDLKSAATEYATENGYTQDEINMAPNPSYITNYNCNPYSYWFGYPSWYPYSYWYPYPFWFDCGFYYDAYGNMVIIGYPSYYFTNWYFYYPEHMHHYPHLCDSYIHHYYGGHHRPADGNSVIVHNWVRDNQKFLPKDFLTNNSARPNVIRQVAQLNEDVKKVQNGKPVSSSVKEEYFKKNAAKYPGLSASHETKTETEGKQQNKTEYIQQPEKLPAVKITNSVQKNTVVPKQNNTKPNYNFNKINNAQEYHKQVWEQTQPSQQQQQKQQPQQQQQKQQPQQQQKQQPQQQQKQQPQQQQRQQPVQQKSNNQNSSGKRK